MIRVGVAIEDLRSKGNLMVFDVKELENILVCPKSKSPLVIDTEHLFCTDPECRLRFEIRDEIPIMLSDEATELSLEEWRVEMQKHGHSVETGTGEN